jgi:predicted transcriptional regulator
MKRSKSKIKGIIESKKSSQADNELVHYLKKYDKKDLADKEKMQYAIQEQALNRIMNSGQQTFYDKNGNIMKI